MTTFSRFTCYFLTLLFLASTTWLSIDLLSYSKEEKSSHIRYQDSFNQIIENEASLLLENKQHQVIFSKDHIRFIPKNKGPQLSWVLLHEAAPEAMPFFVSQGENEHAIAYQRNGMIEQYRIGEQYIEQQFILNEMPDLEDNKLYIKGKIACDGTFFQEEEHSIWQNNYGKVRMGDVTVFDANGTLLAASMIVEKDASTIIVDGSALASAAYPVTIDPVLDAADVNYSSSPSGRNAIDPEVAYNPDDNEYVVVFPADFATAGTNDIYAQRVSPTTGAKVGSPLRVSSMPVGQDALDPDIVYNETSDEFFVVWNTGPNTQKVLGRRIAKNLSSVLGSEVTIGNTTTVSLSLLGNRIAWNSIDNEYFVVFSSVTQASVFTCRDIKAQRISSAGAAVGGLISVETAVCSGSTSRREFYEPDVAYNNDKNEYLVVYRGGESSEFDFEVFYERFSNTGTNIQGKTVMTVTTTPNNLTSFPRVAYNRQGSSTGKYLVTYQTQYGTTSNIEVYAQVIDGNGNTTVGSHFALSNTSDSKNGQNGELMFNPQNNEFLAMWMNYSGGFPDEVWVQRLNASAVTIGSPESVSNSLLFNQVEGGMAIRKNTNEALIVYEAGFPTSDVFGRRYTTSIAPPPPPPLTAGCQNLTVTLSGTTGTLTPSSLNNGTSGGQTPYTFQASQTAFNCSDIGPNAVTLTVTDNNNATSSCSATVTVVSNASPTANCKNITVNLDGTGNASITGGDVNSGSSSVCSNVSLTVTPNVFNCSDIGSNTVTLTATDTGNGLSDPCTATVTIVDNSFPTATCQDITVDLNANGIGVVTPLALNNGSSDNCGIYSFNTSPTTVFCYNLGNNLPVQLTVADRSGNQHSCTANATVRDIIPPNAQCKNSTVNLNANGVVTINSSIVNNGSADNCSIGSMNVSPGSFDCSHIGSSPNPVTLTVTDQSNNSSSCTAQVTVKDVSAPSLTLIGGTLTICEGDLFVDPGATISDNCASGTVQGNSSGVNIHTEGTYSITYNYTDPSGNAAVQISRPVVVEHRPAQLAPQNCGSCDQIRFDFCEGDPSPNLETLLLSNTNYEAGSTFNWYADNSGSQGAAIGNPSINTNRAKTRFYWVSQQDGNCEGPARRVRVRVRPTSTVVFDLPLLGCNTGQINLAAYVSDSRGKATGFSFYDSDPDVGNPAPLGSVTATNGVVDPGQYVIVTVPANPITYYSTAANNTGCQVTASDQVFSSAVATLDPIPNYTFNAGDMVNIAFSGTNISNIIWYDLASFNNPNIGIMGMIGLGNLMFTAQNNTSGPLTATIRVIPYNGNCAGTPQDFTITVNPGSVPRQTRNRLLFTGASLGTGLVQLDWEIQYEFALTHVEVEKLGEDDTWEKIAAVTWQQDQLSYAYVDHAAGAESHTYRLKLIHPDGRAIWSHEVVVSGHADSERFTLFPNPTDGRFSLRAAGPLEGEWQYRLSDQLGRTILIGKLQGSETALDISGLPTAHYFLLLTSPEGKRYWERVVKK